MNKKNTLRFAAAAGVLAAGILASFYWSSGQSSAPDIILPGSETADIGVDVQREQYNSRVVTEVDIDKDSVQRVIATLRRPEQYVYEGAGTYYYEGGENTVTVRGAVRGGLTKVVQSLPGNSYKHIILTGDEVYIWSSGSLSLYRGAAGETSRDELSLIPTYEDVLDVPQEDVLSGGFEEYEGVSCVYAECLNALTGYRDKYYISPASGLLVGAESYDGDALVYRAVITPDDSQQVEDDWFLLPSGTVVTG